MKVRRRPNSDHTERMKVDGYSLAMDDHQFFWIRARNFLRCADDMREWVVERKVGSRSETINTPIIIIA